MNDADAAFATPRVATNNVQYAVLLQELMPYRLFLSLKPENYGERCKERSYHHWQHLPVVVREEGIEFASKDHRLNHILQLARAPLDSLHPRTHSLK